MDAADVFDDLRPNVDPLDAETSRRVWEQIVAGYETPNDRATVARQFAVASGAARRSSRRRLALVGAAAAVAAGLIGVGVVSRFDDDRDQGSFAGPNDPAPEWFALIQPALPPGFEQIAVLQSVDQFVTFEALDPATSRLLNFTVGRVPTPPDPAGPISLETAANEPWTDSGVPAGGIELPDGRQLTVACDFPVVVPDMEPCPPIGSVVTAPEDLRQFALSLAELDPARLPASTDAVPHVPSADILAATVGITLGQEPEIVEAAHSAASFVQFGEPLDPTFVSVRTVTGFYPPGNPDAKPVVVNAYGRRLSRQTMSDGSTWFVVDSPENGGIDVAPEILNAARGQDVALSVPNQVSPSTAPQGDVAHVDPSPTITTPLVDLATVTFDAHYDTHAAMEILVHRCMNANDKRYRRSPNLDPSSENEAVFNDYEAWRDAQIAAAPEWNTTLTSCQEQASIGLVGQVDGRAFAAQVRAEQVSGSDAVWGDPQLAALLDGLVECVEGKGFAVTDPHLEPAQANDEVNEVLGNLVGDLPNNDLFGIDAQRQFIVDRDAALDAVCPTWSRFNTTFVEAMKDFERQWLADHPDVAQQIADEYNDDIRHLQAILDSDDILIGSVDLDSQHLGVSLRDKGAGLCLVTDEFGDVAGCDTAPADLLPATFFTNGNLLYGVVSSGHTVELSVKGETVPVAQADEQPNPYGLRAFIARLSATEDQTNTHPVSGTVTVLDADGAAVATVPFDL